jgi:hypothetical protein
MTGGECPFFLFLLLPESSWAHHNHNSWYERSVLIWNSQSICCCLLRNVIILFHCFVNMRSLMFVSWCLFRLACVTFALWIYSLCETFKDIWRSCCKSWSRSTPYAFMQCQTVIPPWTIFVMVKVIKGNVSYSEELVHFTLTFMHYAVFRAVIWRLLLAELQNYKMT